MAGMRVRLGRVPRWAAAAPVLMVVVSLAGCAAERVTSDPTTMSRPTVGRLDTTMRVLQMNLCNSGRADCYSGGRAISRAVALIHERRPGIVTLNEVCRDDVRVLNEALSATFPATGVVSAFTAARDRPSRAPVRCTNGQEFGIGVLVVMSAPTVGSRSDSGVYPVQDPDDPEDRVWLCVDLATRFSACTTHASSSDTTVALSQCRYLLDAVLPRLSRRNGVGPVILGADLNLAARGSPSPQSCLPRGYQRTDDDRLQDVVVSPGVALEARSVIDMAGTTDHPGLLVDVVLQPH